MTLRIVLEDAASDDLMDAADFYEMQRPGLGIDFLRAIDDCFARIAEHPSVF